MSDPRILHWRRHEDAQIVSDYQDSWIATACGQLCREEEGRSDPAEANCPECAVIAQLLGTDRESLERNLGDMEARKVTSSVSVMLHGLIIGDWRQAQKGRDSINRLFNKYFDEPAERG